MLKKNFKIEEKPAVSSQGGYTIIETMIAISLFIVIVMTGMGALLSANLLHQKSQGMRSIIDNLSFIMEDVSRNLRTGYNFHCLVSGEDSLPTPSMSIPKSCANGWGIAFEYTKGNPDNDDDQWVYYIDNGKIYKSTQGPSSLSNFIQLTPDEVVIDPVSSFIVLGAEPPPDINQPFVTIKLAGTITYKTIITPFSFSISSSLKSGLRYISETISSMFITFLLCTFAQYPVYCWPVNAFDWAPRPASSSAIMLAFGRFFVPLNIMCSRKCERPFVRFVSYSEPASTNIKTVAARLDG